MPKPSRFSGLLPSRMIKIALRIRNRMNQLGLNEGELANRCSRLALDIFPEEEQPRISRERIAKILMNCKASPEKSAARVISLQEMVVLALALKVSLEWLTGQEDNCNPVLWDTLTEPQSAEQLLHLMAEYEEKTGEMSVWGESLLCSLVPPSFMHQYHELHFSELDSLGLHKEKQKLVQTYDKVGNARRKRLLDTQGKRHWTLTQLIFLSELEKIAKGTCEYKRISKELRKKCLENLSKLIADQSLGINLIITRDSDAEDLKVALRDYDRFGVNGNDFTLWAYHSGKVAWSEHVSHISLHRKLLNEFQARAAYRNHEEVLELLTRLCAATE